MFVDFQHKDVYKNRWFTLCLVYRTAVGRPGSRLADDMPTYCCPICQVPPADKALLNHKP